MSNTKRNSRYNKNKINSTYSNKRREERVKPQPLQGFQTLSQVAGLPKKKEYHSNIPVVELGFIEEPVPTCPLCGQPIQNISQSLMNPEGENLHFDCVLDKLNQEYNPKENEKISYIGGGRFGLCEKVEDKWTIKEVIQFESGETHKKMIEYVESLKNV